MNANKLIVGLFFIALFLLFIVIGFIYWPEVKEFSGFSASSSPAIVIDPVNLTWQRATTTIPWANRDSHEVYEFKGKLYITSGLDANATANTIEKTANYEMAKYYNDIWSTTDGLNWKLEKEHATFPPIRSLSIVNFKGALYMMGGWSPETGLNNGIWRSTDGVNWEQIAKKPDWEEREGQQVIEWQGKLWLLGGVNYFAGKKTFNDVWSSDDGIKWTEVTTHAPWESRWDDDIAVFDGKLWLAGGMSSVTESYDDVWSTNDGLNWTVEATSTPWGKRQGHGLINYQGKLWLIGGLGDSKQNELGQTWFTSDGRNWQKTKIDGPWLDREDHGLILWHDKIWILGGMDNEWHWNNDVWFSLIP